MVFSTNQVRQLYVANALTKATAVSPVSAPGTIAVSGVAKEHMYFSYKGATGAMRSDLINVANIVSVKGTSADKMARQLKSYVVKLSPDINGGLPIVGQDYILHIHLKRYVGMSDEDVYDKYGLVHAYRAMSAEKFYQTLKKSLEDNFSREEAKLFNFALEGTKATVTMSTNSNLTLTAVDAGTAGNDIQFQIEAVDAPATSITTEIAGSSVTIKANLPAGAKTYKDLKEAIAADPTASKYITVSYVSGAVACQVEGPTSLSAGGAATGVTITEVPQEWILGTMEQTPVDFTVNCDTVISEAGEEVWGTVKTTPSGEFIQNGKTMADLEYFCLGERGDIYRNVGWPNSFPTKYLVDPTKKYDTLDITYFYAGNNEDVQKSQKTITIIAPVTTLGGHNAINAIIAEVKTLTGLTIADVE